MKPPVHGHGEQTMAKRKKAEVIELNAPEMTNNRLLHAINSLKSTIPFFGGRNGTGTSYGVSPNGLRDYNELFGYGKQLSFDDYYQMYLRGGIARTVVEKLPKACWRDVPKIMVVGVPDGNELTEPLGSASNLDAVYFRPFTYGGTELLSWDTDLISPRYGLPTKYQVQEQNNDNKQKDINQNARVVNWERIVHMAEGGLDSVIEGTSALEPVWNALIDKDKSRGSSAEAYFINALQKFALTAKDGANLDMSTDAKNLLKSEVEGFSNNMQNFMRLMNMDVKVMQPGMESPRDTFDVAIEEIAGTTGIPVRMLTGAGAGDLAGSNDKASWNALVLDRQEQQCSQWLLDTLRILSKAGMIDLPDNAKVVWAPSQSTTEKEQSEVNRNNAQALTTLLQGLSTVAGDEMSMDSVLKSFGFDDIDVDDLPLPVDDGEPQPIDEGDE